MFLREIYKGVRLGSLQLKAKPIVEQNLDGHSFQTFGNIVLKYSFFLFHN